MRASSRVSPPPVLREAIPPAQAELPFAPLLIVPEGNRIQVVLLSNRLETYATHYDAATKRVRWCCQSARCEECGKGWKSRLVWYGCAIVGPAKRPHLLAVPTSAWFYCPELRENKLDLRGRVFELFRLRKSKTGPVKVVAIPKRFDSDKLPSAWPIIEDLAKRWGLNVPKGGTV